MKNRIIQIAKLIKPNSVVADIGSDHAFLSIYLLKNQIAKFVYNIDINNEPLQNGINNLKKHNLLNFTKNINADGLNGLKDLKRIDYVVISGLGGKSMIDILSCKPKLLKIDHLVLCPNNSAYELRKYLAKNKWRFNADKIIVENKYFYNLISVSRTKGKIYKTFQDYYFGLLNLKNKDENFIKYFQSRFNHIKSMNLDKYNKDIKKEMLVLNEQKWIKK